MWSSSFLAPCVEDAVFLTVYVVVFFFFLSSIRGMKFWVLMFGSSSDFKWLLEDISVSKTERTNWNWPKSKLVHPLISISIRYNSLRISLRKTTFQKKWCLGWSSLIEWELLVTVLTSVQMWPWVIADFGGKREPRMPYPPMSLIMHKPPPPIFSRRIGCSCKQTPADIRHTWLALKPLWTSLWITILWGKHF